MFKQGFGEFKYYVGVNSLSQIATRQDRVCVLNILELFPIRLHSLRS